MSKNLFKSVSMVLILRLASAGVLFLFFVFLSRQLGKHEVGLFFLGFAATSILSGLGSLGLYRIVVRLLGAHDQPQEGYLRGTIISRALLAVTAASSVGALGLALLANPVAHWFFQQPELVPILRIMALAIVPMTISMTCGNMLEGLNKPLATVVVLNLLLPLFSLLAGSVWWWQGQLQSASQGAWIFVAGNIATMLVALRLVYSLYQSGRQIDQELPLTVTREQLWSGTTALVLIMLTDQTIRWAGQIVTGMWLSAGDVAVLATAHRTAASLGLILQAINKVVSPRFAALHKRGEYEQIWPVLVHAIKVSTGYALPAFILMVLCSSWLMAIFGKGFSQFWYILVILSLGYLVNAVTGPIAQLLIMVGQEKLLRNITFLTGLFALVATVALTAIGGLVGSALATCLVLIIQNTVVLGHVSRLYRAKAVPVHS